MLLANDKIMRKQFFLYLLLAVSVVINAQTGTSYLFVGTYTHSKPAKGIYVYKMNTQTGELTAAGTGENITNPSFLTISPNGQYLYACTDTKTLLPGTVSAFAIDSIDGKINFINKQSSNGANPVYLAVDKSNQFVITGNYTGGSVAVLTTNKDGSINPASQTIRFSDSSINKIRQEKPHVHSTIFSPGNEYLYLPDLGSDKIRGYIFDAGSSSPLLYNDSLTVKTGAGGGPRHMVFHPSKPFAYCIEEMSGMVVLYACKQGKLTSIQRIQSNKQKIDEYSSADIHVSPDGLFLYSSNRLENTIAIFSINKKGRLQLIGREPTWGEVPRNFTLDPSGNFLLVANQGSNNIVVFKRNRKTGLLQRTGMQVSVPAPSCLQMRVYGK